LFYKGTRLVFIYELFLYIYLHVLMQFLKVYFSSNKLHDGIANCAYILELGVVMNNFNFSGNFILEKKCAVKN
jgi:hypothetical protein